MAYNFDYPGFERPQIENAFRAGFTGRNTRDNIVFIDYSKFMESIDENADMPTDSDFVNAYIDHSRWLFENSCRNAFGVSQWEWE